MITGPSLAATGVVQPMVTDWTIFQMTIESVSVAFRRMSKERLNGAKGLADPETAEPGANRDLTEHLDSLRAQAGRVPTRTAGKSWQIAKKA